MDLLTRLQSYEKLRVYPFGLRNVTLALSANKPAASIALYPLFTSDFEQKHEAPRDIWLFDD